MKLLRKKRTKKIVPKPEPLRSIYRDFFTEYTLDFKQLYAGPEPWVAIRDFLFDGDWDEWR